jgi:site-specific recombinase XerD
MDVSTPTVSPLRQRMVEDMRMRKFEPKTQAGYLRAVRKLTKFLGRSPDTATAEDLRSFQMHLVDEGASPVTLNSTISGLKFFFDITLSRGELMAKMQPVSVPRTLPVVLSREEVSRLIAAAWNLKHQTALAVAYGTGLRASEVIGLKVGDIDSQRMTLRVEQGKGRKDRYAEIAEEKAKPILLPIPASRDRRTGSTVSTRSKHLNRLQAADSSCAHRRQTGRANPPFGPPRQAAHSLYPRAAACMPTRLAISARQIRR